MPTRGEQIGEFAKSNEPYVRQYFIKSTYGATGRELQRKLYLFRKITEYKAKGLDSAKEFYMPSCSIHSIIYKGELRTWQLDEYYPDLKDERLVSSFCYYSLKVLYQYASGVETGSTFQIHCPQWRDQHH